MLSPLADGLFQQVIGHSGSPLASWAFESQQDNEASSRQIATLVRNLI